MAGYLNGSFARFLHRRALARWSAAARGAMQTDLPVLRAQRRQARQLRGALQEFSAIADTRLTLPVIGSDSFPRPTGTDWAWRPDAWRLGLPAPGSAGFSDRVALCEGLTVFHDCPAREIALRQIRNTSKSDLAPFGIAIEVFNFEGNFLSLAVDLPPAACEGLRKRHLFSLSTLITAEFPLIAYARLNIKNGPNTDQDIKTLMLDQPDAPLTFDLVNDQIQIARVEKIWIDLIFEKPKLNLITIRDFTLCRHLRAAF
ncbi:DUF6478 family protein [Yoonia sp.]|uniref:DUF6478 family protein n=1 Tax=Yoonia sp. TaxID=2212373 RepID=UPI0019E28BBD|nr:DUF6478 family protein [Yoonia sp.]MBE0412009.1 hypothetical protein [Yoonia sp.]